ncbi:hypothetical protein G6F50_016807 [Rhizopus delemar]|uniref:Uncharacterized protein n=1 Tax=Rhizopus delemar TaxID=936053 RepID=A0A9P7C144_9FUNG|nr:hypothetical protein G6F50_016807 [Rhizopus delemar]
MLADRPALTTRLIIEVDAAGLVEQGGDLRQLCDIVTAAGARTGIARLSQQFGAMERLHEYPSGQPAPGRHRGGHRHDAGHGRLR